MRILLVIFIMTIFLILGHDESFAESTITPISITSDMYLYEKNQTITISINNEDSSKNAIFNFVLLDPNGKIFKDACISNENPQDNIIRPFSTVKTTWNTKDCKNKVIEGNWKILSHLTSENKLTDLTTDVEIKIVEDIEKYNSPPPNLDFQNEIFHALSVQSNGTSGNYVIMTKYMKYNIPYEITNGTIKEITVYCKGRSLDVEIVSYGMGKLAIKISKELMDPITVLTSNYDTLNMEVNENTFTMQFPSDTKKLEFLGNDGLFIPGSEACKNIHNPPHSYLLPPLKQMKNGVNPMDVICKQGLEVVVRAEKETPACIKSVTKIKLIERGWTRSNGSNLLTYTEGSLIGEDEKKIIQTVLSNMEIEKLLKGKDYTVFQVRDGVWCRDCVCPENGCTLVGFSLVKSEHLGVMMSVILNHVTDEIFEISTSEAWNQD